MPDMLVRLYHLPAELPGFPDLARDGIEIRRALPPDKSRIVRWVTENFDEYWGSECDVSFSNKPVSCFVAVANKVKIVGFACYEATCKDYFGPTGVAAGYRGRGIGKALFLRCLYAMREMGYAYAVIGGAEEAMEFYRKTAGAFVIPDSVPGIYRDMIGN